MVCDAVQHNQTKPTGSNSGAIPSCIAIPVGFFIGDSQMNRIDISTPNHLNTFTLVDDADYEWLNQWKWCALKGANGLYVVRGVYLGGGRKNRKYKTIRMQRLILNVNSGMVVDHINGDTLNNQRDNLRICTQRENSYNTKRPSDNTSGFKGVSWSKSRGKWEARIKANGKHKFLGYFDNKKEAAKTYDCSAKELFGEFAYLNFKKG